MVRVVSRCDRTGADTARLVAGAHFAHIIPN
jgi:hypothetical protein